jgi:hypothetical protein
MNLDSLFLDNLFIDKKLRNFLALVTLELNDIAELGILDNGAVAAKILLEHFENFVEIHLLGNATGSGEGLATVALLNANVNIIGRFRRGCSFIQFIRCKRVCTMKKINKKNSTRSRESEKFCAVDENSRQIGDFFSFFLSFFLEILPNVAVLSKSSAIKLVCFACFL